MKIDKERLWNHLMELKEIGKNSDGSVTRFPFTNEDKQAQEQIVEWMSNAGLNVHIDYVGNIIGTLQGSDETLPAIMCGSHYDSVKNGGAFDGCLGVLAGIEVLQTLIENKIQPKRSIQVVGFKDEEGNRFPYGMVGSKSICATFGKEGFSSQDESGISLYDAMSSFGLQPDRYRECQLHPFMFLEIHIEQARLLEDRDKAIGIVQGIAGLSRFTISIHGECAHAGATPMAYRHDPVVAMSEWILHISELSKQYQGMVATIGSIQTNPGVCNVICDHVTYTLDLRSLKDEDRKQVMEVIKSFNKELEIKHGVSITMIEEQCLVSCLCDEILQDTLKSICIEKNIPYEELVSGAGHDCMNFKDICKVAMIFVRSKAGYSHRKEEFSSKEDCALGAEILYEFLLKQV